MAEITVSSCAHQARAKIMLRVPMSDAARVAQAMSLPAPMCWTGEDPALLWVGPDQWLILSDAQTADELIFDCAARLQSVLHHAVDASAGIACVVVEGVSARVLLGMASGVDFHPRAFGVGRCVRTRFANVSALIRAVAPDGFELYVDRSVTDYLERWFAHASADPLLRSPALRKETESALHGGHA